MAPTPPVPIARWDAAQDVWIRIPNQDMLPIFEPSDVYSETFETSGLMQRGMVSPLPASGHRTDGSGCSSSPGLNALALLPTPTVSDTNGAGSHGDGGLDLRTAVSLLPTPRAVMLLPTPMASDWKGPNHSGSGSASARGIATTALTLLPTPTAAGESGMSPEARLASGHQMELGTVVKTLGTTPIGVSTPPPSDDGRLF